MEKSKALRIIAGISAIGAYYYARTLWPFPENLSEELATFFSWATAIEALLFGIGIAFIGLLFTELSKAKESWTTLEWATFFSIAWILVSGYPHDSMHIVSEGNLSTLVRIEILFHGSLAIAALIVAYAFFKHYKKKKA